MSGRLYVLSATWVGIRHPATRRNAEERIGTRRVVKDSDGFIFGKAWRLGYKRVLLSRNLRDDQELLAVPCIRGAQLVQTRDDELKDQTQEVQVVR